MESAKAQIALLDRAFQHGARTCLGILDRVLDHKLHADFAMDRVIRAALEVVLDEMRLTATLTPYTDTGVTNDTQDNQIS